MNKKNKFIEFVLCIENKDCDDLEKRKVYAVKPDSKAEEDGYLRIIDDLERIIYILKLISLPSNFLRSFKIVYS